MGLREERNRRQEKRKKTHAEERRKKSKQSNMSNCRGKTGKAGQKVRFLTLSNWASNPSPRPKPSIAIYTHQGPSPNQGPIAKPNLNWAPKYSKPTLNMHPPHPNVQLHS
jgi:hypothetical protein